MAKQRMLGDMPVGEVRRLATRYGIDHFKVRLGDSQKGWPVWRVEAALRSGVTIHEEHQDVCQGVANLLRAAAELEGA